MIRLPDGKVTARNGADARVSVIGILVPQNPQGPRAARDRTEKPSRIRRDE